MPCATISCPEPVSSMNRRSHRLNRPPDLARQSLTAEDVGSKTESSLLRPPLFASALCAQQRRPHSDRVQCETDHEKRDLTDRISLDEARRTAERVRRLPVDP